MPAMCDTFIDLNNKTKNLKECMIYIEVNRSDCLGECFVWEHGHYAKSCANKNAYGHSG